MNREGQYLYKAVGNNLFSYEERKILRDENPKLYTPPMVSDKSIDDLAWTENIAFEEVENGVLKQGKALNFYLKTQYGEKNIPLCIMDNHNFAWYFWMQMLQEDTLKTGGTLIHIDQHKDMREPSRMPTDDDIKDESSIYAYTTEVLNVGNYIFPALKQGIFSQVHILDGETSLKKHSTLAGPVAVNIDMDIFSPEMGLNQEFLLQTIQSYIQQADCITVALSPYFIDEDLSLKLLKKLFL